MSKIYRFLAANLLILGLLLSATAGVASAHVLKEDNGISGVLHIPPEDNPMAGQPTELDVLFGDEANNFNLNDCNCQVTVKSNNAVLQTVALEPYSPGDTVNTKAIVRFPKVDVYQVAVSGSAKNGQFNSFELNYLVQVAVSANGTDSKAGQGGGVLMIGLGSLIILAMIAYAYIKAGGRYASEKPKRS